MSEIQGLFYEYVGYCAIIEQDYTINSVSWNHFFIAYIPLSRDAFTVQPCQQSTLLMVASVYVYSLQGYQVQSYFSISVS